MYVDKLSNRYFIIIRSLVLPKPLFLDCSGRPNSQAGLKEGSDRSADGPAQVQEESPETSWFRKSL